MCGSPVPMRAMILASAAALLAAPARADVEMLGGTAVFYRFGAGSLNQQVLYVIQETTVGPGTSAASVAGVSSTITSELSSQLAGAPRVWHLRINVDQTATVSALTTKPVALAEAGGGLDALMFTVRISGAPVIVTRAAAGFKNYDTKEPLVVGATLPPGEHTFFDPRGFQNIDLDAVAIRGESFTVHSNEDLDFRFVAHPACHADWSADSAVDSFDISAFLTSWVASTAGGDLVADVSGDAEVNSGDISAFLTLWLAAVQSGC